MATVLSITHGRYSSRELAAVQDGSSSDLSFKFADDTDTGWYSPADGEIVIQTDGTERIKFNSSGATIADLIVSDDFTFTGASYNVVWDKSDNALEFADNAKLVLGSGDDLQILHDGSNSYLKNTTGNITIEAKSGETSVKCIPDAAVELYHDNSKKLETKSTGVDVTGKLTISGDLQVDGTTTTVNSTTLTIDDKNIVVASGAANNAAADGAGLTIDAGSDTDKTWNYVNSTGSWTSSEHIHIGDLSLIHI